MLCITGMHVLSTKLIPVHLPNTANFKNIVIATKQRGIISIKRLYEKVLKKNIWRIPMYLWQPFFPLNRLHAQYCFSRAMKSHLLKKIHIVLFLGLFSFLLNLSESCVDVFGIHDSSIKPSVEPFVHYIAEDTVSVTLYQCLKRTFLGNDWGELHLLKFRLFIPYNVSPVISLK